jgi:hypothetical protein
MERWGGGLFSMDNWEVSLVCMSLPREQPAGGELRPAGSPDRDARSRGMFQNAATMPFVGSSENGNSSGVMSDA